MTEEGEVLTEQDMREIMKAAEAMKGNAPTQEDKQSIHAFLNKVATSDDTIKTGNLRDDNEINELGVPNNDIRGLKKLERIARMVMNNEFIADFFKQEAEDVLATSLSRGGFLVRQATTQTKQVADITKRKKTNKGWFGKKKTEEQGGDTTGSQ